MSTPNQSYPIEPLFENVLIEPIDEYDKKLPSGLLTVEPKAGEKPLIGIVRGVPTKEYTEKGATITPKVPVNVGDKVLYRKWSMSEIKYQGKELLVVGQKDIAAIIRY